MDSYAYGINANGDVNLYSAAFDFDTDTWSGEFKLDGKLEVFDRPTKLTFGLDHLDNERARTDAYAPLGIANIYDENFDDFPTIQPTNISRDAVTRNKSTGVYGQVVFEPTDRLHILFGGRYDWADSTYIDHLNDIKTEKQDQAFTGRVGITYDITDNVSVYGLYAQSFSPVTEVSSDGEILDPEEGEIWEAGIKTEWLDGKLGANLAVFRIERTNVPIPEPGLGGGSVAGGLQRSDGVELELNGAPLPGWNVSFGGILLDSEFVEEHDPFHGSRPAGAADWQVGLFTSYELQDGPLKGLGLGGGLFAIGDRGVSPFQPGTELEGYERVDLKAFYNGLEPFKIALQVRNLFDEKYVEGADRTGAYAQFGSPRAVLLTVSAKW
jgi:outer membrane receptor protein involved in Fe transport